MVTIALIGAHGAGKTTLGRALERSDEFPIKYLYMGLGARSSGSPLPTTRALLEFEDVLGLGDAAAARRERAGRLPRGFLDALGSALAFCASAGEEWYRASLARRFERRGFVVLCDRHFFVDYWIHDLARAGRTLLQRAHGRFLARLPRPDCTIVLDAPAAVLSARKGGAPERLERRRREYLALQNVLGNCRVVDADRPQGEVEAEVLGILRELTTDGEHVS